ncbi:MAG: hypothetical protein IPL84_03860 [Chitinophagaceae bacterium]|nr:hypothetical protein [Chitinophagaceae bacterium]
MLKLFVNIFLLFVILSEVEVCQTAKASFVKEVSVDESTYIVWSGYVIDSAYLNVWLLNGDLPRRANGTYLYWKADTNGNLIPRRKIDYRLPIFQDKSVVMKREDENFFK